MLAHLRTIVPGDALVAGLNAARADVAAQRQARRQKRAVQVQSISATAYEPLFRSILDMGLPISRRVASPCLSQC